MCFGALEQDVEKDLDDLLGDEGERPREHIHVIRKYKRVLRVVILLNLNLVVFESQHCGLVIIYIAVVRRTEYGDDRGEFRRAIPLMQFVPIHLYFVGTHHTQEII